MKQAIEKLEIAQEILAHTPKGETLTDSQLEKIKKATDLISEALAEPYSRHNASQLSETENIKILNNGGSVKATDFARSMGIEVIEIK